MLTKTIFLSTGRTFTFRDVTNVVENETSISFGYTAVSDGNLKSVVFYRPGMAGHSTCESYVLAGKKAVEVPGSIKYVDDMLGVAH